MNVLSLPRGASAGTWLAAATLVILPLFITPHVTSDSFVTPKIALLGASLGLWAGLRLYRLAAGVRGPGTVRLLAIPLLAAVVPVVVSWIAGPYKEWSLFGEYTRYTGLVPTLLLAGFAAALIHSLPHRPDLIVRCLMVSGTLVAVYAILQIVGLDPIGWPLQADIHKGFATIGQYNVSGAFLAIVLPLLTAHLWESRGSWLLRISSAIVLVAVVIIDSQGPWVAAVAGSAMAVGLCLRHPRGALLGSLGALGITLTLTVLVLVPVLLPHTYSSIEANISTRGDFWVAAAGMGSQYPIAGRGPNSYAVESVQYRPVHNARIYIYRWTTDAHSVLMNNFGSMGLLGAGGFLLIAMWVVYRILAIARDPGRRAWQIGAAGAAVAYLTQAIITIDDFTVRFAFWVVLVLLALPKQLEPEKRPAAPAGRMRSGRLMGAVAGSTLAVLAGWTSFRFLWADHHFVHGYRLMQERRYEEGEAELRAALSLRDEYAYREGYAQLLGQAALDPKTPGRPLIDRMNEQYEHLETFPSVVPLVRQAAELLRWTQVDPSLIPQTIDLFERALALDEGNPYIAIGLADAWLAADEPEEAVGVLRSFSSLPPDYPRYWGAMALAQAAAGNEPAARTYLELALRVDPQDARALEAMDLIGEGGRSA